MVYFIICGFGQFCCCRGHLNTFIHTVHLLQGLGTLQDLPVGDIIKKLLEMEGGQGQPSSVVGSKHILCWGFEDMLQYAEKEVPANRAQGSNNASNGNQAEKGMYCVSVQEHFCKYLM